MKLRQHQRADQRLRQVGMLAERERHVLVDVQVRQQRTVLEQHAHALAKRIECRCGRGRGSLSPHHHAALGGRDLPGEEPQQRGLAGAAGPHDRGDATLADLDVEAVEDLPRRDAVVRVRTSTTTSSAGRAGWLGHRGEQAT